MKILDQLKKIINKIKNSLKTNIITQISAAGLISIALYFLFFNKTKTKIYNVKLSNFIQALNQNRISQVIIKGTNNILFKAAGNNYKTNASGLSTNQIFQMLKNKNITYSCQNKQQSLEYLYLIWFVLSLLLGKLSYNLLFSKNQKFGQSNNLTNKINITFKDIYGLEKPKQALTQTIDYLKNPEKYIKIGCRLRKGIIFYGPPGTGKTLLAKATAGQTGSQFIFCSASQFCQMYVGVGAKRVRQLFEKARSFNTAIIFIDQIDAIGKRKGQIDSADSERNSTLNQLLIQMDGFNNQGNIFVIAATNRLQMIDQALLRSGRFDLKINVGLPNKQQRLGILKLHLQKKAVQISEKLIITISQRSQGLSGADLENLANEAAYKALKKQQNYDRITDIDLEKAFIQIPKSKFKY